MSVRYHGCNSWLETDFTPEALRCEIGVCVRVLALRRWDRTDKPRTWWKQRLRELCNEPDGNLFLIIKAPAMYAAIERLLDCPDLNLDELEPETRAAIQQAYEAMPETEGA